MPEDEVRGKLIPRFSLRWLFAVTAIVAVAFSVVGLGVRSNNWAAAVSFAMGSLVVLVLTYAMMFAAVWLFSVVFGQFLTWPSSAGHSPFVANAGSAAATNSPFAGPDNEQPGEGPAAPAVEAILVEIPDDSSHSDPGSGRD